MAKNRRSWVYSPSKSVKPKAPDSVKSVVTAKANQLVETVIKPKSIKPPPENGNHNYIVDIYTKWYRNYFYFCAKYCCPGPNAMAPSFESKFARMEYVRDDCFNLSYMRHTDQWWELFPELSLDDCLEAIKEQPHFIPL